MRKFVGLLVAIVVAFVCSGTATAGNFAGGRDNSTTVNLMKILAEHSDDSAVNPVDVMKQTSEWQNGDEQKPDGYDVPSHQNDYDGNVDIPRPQPGNTCEDWFAKFDMTNRSIVIPVVVVSTDAHGEPRADGHYRVCYRLVLSLTDQNTFKIKSAVRLPYCPSKGPVVYEQGHEHR